VLPAYDNPVVSEIDANNINLETAGRLEIPSLGINVPVIWTKNTKNFETDLQKGVVHYPGTALPGQIGTTYISGHSSNYAWAKGEYNKVFSKLGDLPDNSSFIVTVVQKNGQDARLHYVVIKRKEFSPTDQEQFRNTGDSLVALSTCWPIGSTKSRLVVFGKLTQVEK
jgi:sortase A